MFEVLFSAELVYGRNVVKRNISLDEISDGKLYGLNDMVKAGCGDCSGCSSCCRGMGSSIVLDPYDVFRLTSGLGMTFEELMRDKIELNVVDGIILPNLKMVRAAPSMAGDGAEEKCAFLDGRGRCGIHPLRPGICRLFPLGRYYENGGFRYFLQTHECRKLNRTKVKVEKWIDTPDVKRNQDFVTQWHYFLNDMEDMVRENGDESFARNLNLYILNVFYVKPYVPEDDFYIQFAQRMESACGLFGGTGAGDSM